MIFITSLCIFIIAVITQNLYAVGKRVMPLQFLSSIYGSYLLSQRLVFVSTYFQVS